MNNNLPVEIERKYVIRMPDIDELKRQDGYSVSKIEQTYLDSEPAVTHRVRKRVYKDKIVYTETKKVRIDEISSFEDERGIDEAEYLCLLQKIKSGTRTLTKVRHTFAFSGQMFEVDIYPEWTHSCIMETELETRDTSVDMPLFISMIKDVTGERKYSNAAMSREFPEELILYK